MISVNEALEIHESFLCICIYSYIQIYILIEAFQRQILEILDHLITIQMNS